MCHFKWSVNSAFFRYSQNTPFGQNDSLGTRISVQEPYLKRNLRRTKRNNLIILFLLLFSLSPAYAADEHIIFLHHSTGGVIFDDGHVFDWFSAYNAAHNFSYSITERAYPTGTYPWENYPYDYWNLWVNGACRADEPSRHCLAQLAAEYDLVIFKNCYPVIPIEEDTGSPDIKSSRKSLENYKLQYSAVRDTLK